MNKVVLSIFFALFICFTGYAQNNSGIAADIGYTYNKRNLGYIGASASYHKGN